MKRICVFCGSHSGADPAYIRSARELGRLLASRHIELVYGGGSCGLMGAIADAVLDAGGRVIGVVPERLFQPVHVHSGLTELHWVASLLERKKLMADLSEGFIALPGGIGTLDELLEMMTWSQLGIHTKPSGLLNISGYYDPLLAFLDTMVAKGFLAKEQRSMLLLAERPVDILDMLTGCRPATRSSSAPGDC